MKTRFYQPSAGSLRSFAARTGLRPVLFAKGSLRQLCYYASLLIELDKDLIKAVLAKASTFKKADVAAAPVHEDWTCRECFLEPIIGHRFTCLICRGYTLCQSCEKKGLHAHHALVRTVTDDFAVPDVYESINWVLGETS
uniref:ZZ-type domain-containing protein n=1 Tax=Panagrellus redivivus TaxID=6233 RepID=A0A7E4VIN4_PANRE